jgi:hypothetical protein
LGEELRASRIWECPVEQVQGDRDEGDWGQDDEAYLLRDSKT